MNYEFSGKTEQFEDKDDAIRYAQAYRESLAGKKIVLVKYTTPGGAIKQGTLLKTAGATNDGRPYLRVRLKDNKDNNDIVNVFRLNEIKVIDQEPKEESDDIDKQPLEALKFRLLNKEL